MLLSWPSFPDGLSWGSSTSPHHLPVEEEYCCGHFTLYHRIPSHLEENAEPILLTGGLLVVMTQFLLHDEECFLHGNSHVEGSNNTDARVVVLAQGQFRGSRTKLLSLGLNSAGLSLGVGTRQERLAREVIRSCSLGHSYFVGQCRQIIGWRTAC